MIKTRLLLGAAIAAFGIIPVAAQADQVTVSMSASWDNTVDVDLAWSVDVTKNLNIDGSIEISGEVDANALSQASLDDKQIVDGNSVQFEDYQNATRTKSSAPALNLASARAKATRSSRKKALRAVPQSTPTPSRLATARCPTLRAISA
jgi:hypothetical protein